MPVVLLDSTTLGVLTNPANKIEPLRCSFWAEGLYSAGISLAVPAVIDYEHRRELYFIGGAKSLERLEELGKYIAYLPFNDRSWKKAATLWAWARRSHQSTAHREKIDIDVLLAAQAIALSEDLGEPVVIATDNFDDLLRYSIPAKPWREITVQYCKDPSSVSPPTLVRINSASNS